MPRPGKMDRVQEKPKNFFGSLLKLFRNLRTWKVLMVISLILAVSGSIFSLIAPNQLSKLTDEITLGIKPDTDKLVEITTAIMNNTNQEVLTIDGVTISLEDQYKYLEIVPRRLVYYLSCLNDQFHNVKEAHRNISPDANSILEDFSSRFGLD